MPGLRILNLEPDHYSSAAHSILRELGQVANGPLTREQLLACLPEFDVLIVRLGHRIDSAVLERGKGLKAVVSATTGLNHIDLAAAERQGIAVLSLQGETEFLRSIPATAEHTWGLLLALVRHIPQAVNSVLAGAWDRDAFRGNDLSGKRLGILGLGRIGEKVAVYGQAFGMRVSAHDPYRQGWQDGVIRSDSMEALFTASDVLTVHVPLNPQTESLVGSKELTWLPKGARLINTSRGEILDEAALVEALESGHLAGAALDVIQGERSPDWAESPLIRYAKAHDNLLITPHLGGATAESMEATEIFMAKKLAQFLRES